MVVKDPIQLTPVQRSLLRGLIEKDIIYLVLICVGTQEALLIKLSWLTSLKYLEETVFSCVCCTFQCPCADSLHLQNESKAQNSNSPFEWRGAGCDRELV